VDRLDGGRSWWIERVDDGRVERAEDGRGTESPELLDVEGCITTRSRRRSRCTCEA
jgi:hypothetical protein